jgi:tetratricopeptide (TPR) repeat protein
VRVRLLCAIARARIEAKRPEEAGLAIRRCIELIRGGAGSTRDECLEVSRLAREALPDDPATARLLDEDLARCAPGDDALGRFRTLCGLAGIHRQRGRAREEVACLKEASETARQSGSRALMAEAEWLAARSAKGGLKAMTQLRRCLEVFRELGDHVAARHVEAHLLLSKLEHGKFTRSGRRAQLLGESWAKTARDAEGHAGEEGRERTASAAQPLVLVARAARLAGDLEGAETALEKALAALGEETGGALLLAATGTAARVALAKGKVRRAYEMNLRALRCALSDGSPERTAEALLGFGEFFVQGGAFATAMGVARGGLALARTGRGTGELPLRCLLGRLAVEVGDPAENELERAAELATTFHMPDETCQLYLERGWERFQRGALVDALSEAEQGIDLAARCGFRPLRAELLHLLGAAGCAAHDARAGDALEEALAESRAIAMPRLEWEILHATAWRHSLRGESELARAAASRAEEISLRVLGEVPRILQGIRWRSRLAVAHQGARRSKLC